ncbi:hypothetical protein SAMN05421803_10217 [Nocardiopsis flavescens]|uniref:Uncharacterized protein n=1 Tax=Nocardiopsis flavescens TaxID=758803 RepID=A0A1M6DUQ3_9ACTN|nr:DUF6114 domain-containing protein [Nocardiopsis flavescens]SHI76738.1 hypothetical protein SAMN05421803_10217 [Nocardiopsis flavescens]
MTRALALLRSGWGRFRSWRRARPFWGGAVLVAAGVELLVAPAAQTLVLPIDLIVYAGVAGVSGTLIAALMIVLGALSWFQPAQHTFFGVVGVLLALVTFVTSNFGGFVIGMLLGIVGGSLVFAWGPKARRRPGGRRRARAPQGPGPDEVPDPGGAGGGTRPAAALALPLAAALLLASAPAPALGWPWDWLFPGGGHEQSPEDPPPSPSPSPSPSPGDPGGEDPPEGPGAEEGQEEQEGEEEDGAGGDTDVPEADPADCEFRTGEGALAGSEQEFADAVLACRAAREAGELPAVAVDGGRDCFQGSVRTSGLTADVLTMSGARYDGVVECPTADGPRRYLRLTMNRAEVTGGDLWFEEHGTRMSLGLPSMTLDGDVVLHVTRMRIEIFGIPLPVTFTPDFPPPLLLPYMFVTEVDVSSPMAGTDRMNITDLNGRFDG